MTTWTSRFYPNVLRNARGVGTLPLLPPYLAVSNRGEKDLFRNTRDLYFGLILLSIGAGIRFLIYLHLQTLLLSLFILVRAYNLLTFLWCVQYLVTLFIRVIVMNLLRFAFLNHKQRFLSLFVV